MTTKYTHKYTHNLGRGWLNIERVEPIVEYEGVAWKTKDGLPVMIPDSWYETASDKLKEEMPLLPEGVPFKKLAADV